VNLLFSTWRPAHWESSRLGIAPYTPILSANGQRLDTPKDLARLVAAHPIGSPISYEVLQAGQARTVTIKTRRFERTDYVDFVLPMLLSSAGFLLIGTIAFWLKPHHPTAQSHLLLSVAFGLYNLGTYFWFNFHRFPHAHLFVINLIGSTLIHLALTFPSPKAFLRRRPWLAALPYLPALACLGANALWYRPLGYAASPAIHHYYRVYLSLFSGWTVLGLLCLLGSLTFTMLKGGTPRAQTQAKIVLLGSFAAFAPQVFIYLLPTILKREASISALGVILGVVGFHMFPLAVAYAIVRHQLFDIQLVIRRATLYLGLTALLAALYILAAGIAYDLLGRLTPLAPGPSLPGFLAALSVAVAFRPLHDRLRRTLDRIFLGERADALRLLADFTPEGGLETEALTSRILDLVQAALAPRWIRLELAGGHVAARGEPPGANDAHLAVALSDGARLVIGPRSNELPYGPEERGLIEVLAAQSALALQGARLFEERLRSLIQEGVAVRLAEERAAMGLQVIRELQDDLLAIAHATDEAERNPLDATALNAIPERLDRIEEALSEKTRWIKGQGEAP
jgi:hypothetical protein